MLKAPRPVKSSISMASRSSATPALPAGSRRAQPVQFHRDHERAVEFIFDFDVYKLEMQRERLTERIAFNARNWSVTREELERFVLLSGGGLPLYGPSGSSMSGI